MYKNNSYLISTLHGTRARKARTKTLNEVLKDFSPDEYIFIHEDGKCIFHGFLKDYKSKGEL